MVAVDEQGRQRYRPQLWAKIRPREHALQVYHDFERAPVHHHPGPPSRRFRRDRVAGFAEKRRAAAAITCARSMHNAAGVFSRLASSTPSGLSGLFIMNGVIVDTSTTRSMRLLP